MHVNLPHSLPILVLSGLLTAIQPASAASPATKEPPAKPPSTYPQIVRLTYVEGDVRISRGNAAGKQLHQQGEQASDWEQAVANLPLETGYSLVTGNGRAEIEFEDASVVYLGSNSVLTFNELSTTGGIPFTELGLLSGTATLHVKPMVWREYFDLITPTDHIAITYPQKAYLRVDSYLDAMSVTPQQGVSYRLRGATTARPQQAGQTMTYSHGRRILTPVAMDASAESEWDTWVAQRVAARSKAMTAAMTEAGLASPVPGLDALNGQGHFFACAPYGTCWEPTNGWTGQPAGSPQAGTQPIAGPAIQGPPAAAGQAPPAVEQPASAGARKGAPKPKVAGQSAADAYLASHPGATFYTEDYTFPCSAFDEQDLMAVDPVTGKTQLVSADLSPGWYPLLAGYPIGYLRRGLNPFWAFDAFGGFYPWDWAVCHTGGWVRWQHHYVWVAGEKRHHRRPIRWVKTGRTVGYVPLHPRDVAGKPPISLKDGIFRVTGKQDQSVQRIAFDDAPDLKLMAEAPKEFRNPVLEPLKSTDTPQAYAHSIYGAAVVARSETPGKGAPIANSLLAKGLAARDHGTPIAFNHKSQSFTVARQVSAGGRSNTVVQSLGGAGNSSRSGGAGSSMARASSSGGYSNGGGGGARASASFGGGGGGGGGGAFHGGGGGGAPSGGGGGGASSAGGARK